MVLHDIALIILIFYVLMGDGSAWEVLMLIIMLYSIVFLINQYRKVVDYFDAKRREKRGCTVPKRERCSKCGRIKERHYVEVSSTSDEESDIRVEGCTGCSSPKKCCENDRYNRHKCDCEIRKRATYNDSYSPSSNSGSSFGFGEDNCSDSWWSDDCSNDCSDGGDCGSDGD